MRAGSALRERLTVVLIGAALAVAVPGVAGAAEPESAEAVETARFAFIEGTSHYQARRWAEALRSFEQSLSLVASPNTNLMIARCLRELGRRPEAVSAFSGAAVEARARVARGEAKYGQTAEAADKEGSAVRAQLGTLHVRVSRPAGAALSVDRKPIALSTDGDAVIVHDPGTVVVVVTDANGAEQRQTVNLVAATTVEAEFTLQAAPRAPPPPPPPVVVPPPDSPRDRSWTRPAAIISGGLAAAGLGTFIGFGLSSQATFDDLERRCGTLGCGAADRDDADNGKRAQTIANVGLAVAAVAVAATVVFVVLGVRGDRGR
jgi:hypothetical protein